jgi:signal transduction histidine kinase
MASLDEKAKEYIDFAVDGANRLDNMIKDLLEYYRAVNITASETVDLNEVLKEVQQLLKKQIEESKARITSDSLPVLPGSSTGWRQVFQNLVSNAIKFVPDNRIPEIKLSSKQTYETWQISVSDNGIGIAPEHRKNIFDLFKRGKNRKEFEGTGMGLAIAEKIIDNLEGQIRFEPELNKGTTFYITLYKNR